MMHRFSCLSVVFSLLANGVVSLGRTGQDHQEPLKGSFSPDDCPDYTSYAAHPQYVLVETKVLVVPSDRHPVHLPAKGRSSCHFSGRMHSVGHFSLMPLKKSSMTLPVA
jgi:hypothetical protein